MLFLIVLLYQCDAIIIINITLYEWTLLHILFLYFIYVFNRKLVGERWNSFLVWDGKCINRIILLSPGSSYIFRAYCNIAFCLETQWFPDYDFLCSANKIFILRTADAESHWNSERYVLSYVGAGYFISSCALYEMSDSPLLREICIRKGT